MTEFDFNPNDVRELSEQIEGRTVSSVESDRSRTEDTLVITFTDGVVLRIRYSHIYDYEMSEPDAAASENE